MFEREFMMLAIDEAKKSSEPLKCGAVIVRNGTIVSAAYNSQRSDNDATAHAEIKAIGQAGKQLRQKNLEGSIIFCTCEPCTMCLSAVVFAKVEKLYFGASLDAISDGHVKFTVDEFLERSPRKIEIIKNFMEGEVMTECEYVRV